MNQAATIEQLTVQLDRIENEIVTLRQEFAALKSQNQQNGNQKLPFDFVPKYIIQEHFRRFFEALGIEGEPIGAEALQKMMHEEGLGPNELSSAIIAAREE